MESILECEQVSLVSQQIPHKEQPDMRDTLLETDFSARAPGGPEQVVFGVL